MRARQSLLAPCCHLPHRARGSLCLAAPLLADVGTNPSALIAGLDPAIHPTERNIFRWMPGSSPRMTNREQWLPLSIIPLSLLPLSPLHSEPPTHSVLSQ